MKHSIKYLILTGWLILTSLMHGYAQIRMGAEQTEFYFPLIEGKRVALVVNQTSLIGEKGSIGGQSNFFNRRKTSARLLI